MVLSYDSPSLHCWYKLIKYEWTTTEPNFVSWESLHVKVDEIDWNQTGMRPGWSGLCHLVRSRKSTFPVPTTTATTSINAWEEYDISEHHFILYAIRVILTIYSIPSWLISTKVHIHWCTYYWCIGTWCGGRFYCEYLLNFLGW